MGEVFQIMNRNAPQHGKERCRLWLEPGYPKVPLPGVLIVLMVDRENELFTSRLQIDICAQAMCDSGEAYQFWATPKAIKADGAGRPLRMLVEFSFNRIPVARITQH